LQRENTELRAQLKNQMQTLSDMDEFGDHVAEPDMETDEKQSERENMSMQTQKVKREDLHDELDDSLAENRKADHEHTVWSPPEKDKSKWTKEESDQRSVVFDIEGQLLFLLGLLRIFQLSVDPLERPLIFPQCTFKPLHFEHIIPQIL